MSRIILILLLSLSALCFAADLPSAAIPQFHLQDTQPPCIPSNTNKLEFADFDRGIELPNTHIITGIATADLNSDGLIDLGFACFRGGANAFYIQYD